MDAPDPVLWMLSAYFLVIAAPSAYRLVAAHPGAPPRHEVDRGDEVAEVLMALGMFAMVSPVGGPIPHAGWEAVFVVAAVWLAARWFRLLRARAGPGCGHGHVRSQCGHHAVGTAVMFYMFAGMAGDGHAGHDTQPWLVLAGHEGSLVLTPLAVAAATYFLVDIVLCGVRCVRGRGGNGSHRPPAPALFSSGVRESSRAAMNVAMAGMLLAMA
ncbi:DUF5134 domain-containing protein [Haloechinothrix sp. YIM 98757]|uniref:DUF5134 domain-containing protein n=1 Tax=Haloechinothrix aidingensis TaxID=2752311 RepID=A0A838ACS7_9PSEU|nr:DUF5134 domain-containing protein [Haloechinothrix aidingensis]MBA0127023.1 DUF5134 domain-containing protein [Haloechinothrix aidingensis]